MTAAVKPAGARFAFVLLLGAVAACSPPGPALVAIPEPNLAALEPAVQTELRAARSELDQRLSQSGITPKAFADAYGELGMRYQAQGIREPAEACYVNAERLSPTDAQWPYYLALVRRDSGHVDEAIAGFIRVLELEPNNAAAQLQLAQLYLRVNKTDEAIALAQKAMAQSEAQPGVRAAALSVLAKAELAKHDYTHASEHFEAALKLVPSASKLHQPLAMAYRGLGNIAGAEQQLALHNEKGSEPVAPDPRSDKLQELTAGSLSYLARGERAVQAQQYELALQAFEKAVAMDPNNKDARFNLGVSYSRVGRIIEARDQFQTAVRIAPDDAAAHYALGVVYDRLGLDAPAMDEYRRVIALDPQHVKAHFFLAEALVRARRYPAAIEQYRWVMDHQRDDAQVPLHMAMAQARSGHYSDARKTLDAALAAHGKHAALWNALARILATAPDASTRNGPLALSMAQDLFGAVKDPDYAQTLAMALAESGRYAEAATVQQTAIDKAAEQGITQALPFMRANLASFQRQRPARAAWPDDDSLFRVTPATAGSNAASSTPSPAPASVAPASSASRV